MKAILQRTVEAVSAYYYKEPVRSQAAVAAVVVVVLGAVGYVTDVVHVTPWLLIILPIIFGTGEQARKQTRAVATSIPLPEPVPAPSSLAIADGDNSAVDVKRGGQAVYTIDPEEHPTTQHPRASRSRTRREPEAGVDPVEPHPEA